MPNQARLRGKAWLTTAAVGLVLAAGSAAFGQGTEVINEPFADGAAKPESMVRILGGSSSIIEPVAGSGDWVLQLTAALNSQFGVVWFDVPFNLRENVVEFKVQTFIWAGSSPPADGMAAAFQIFGDKNAADRTNVSGEAGGALGLTNMAVGGAGAGARSSYYAIGWDIWDNSEAGNPFDPEGPCAWRSAAFAGGGNHSAHVEIDRLIVGANGTILNNQPVGADSHVNGTGTSADVGGTRGAVANNCDRGIRLPYMVNDELEDPGRGPNDVIPIDRAVGDIWGPAGILLPVMEWTVTFESGFTTVQLDEITEFGGEVFAPILYDPNEFNPDGSPNPNFQLPWNNRADVDRVVILAATPEVQNEAIIPDADAILGFFASTGGANARQEVDNVRVTTFDNPRELVDAPETERESGGINCGGPAVIGTAFGDFLADRQFGNILSVDTVSDPNAIILTRTCPGFTDGGSTGGDASTPVLNLIDPSIEALYQTKRFDSDRVAYTACVPNGRYAVDLGMITDSIVLIEGIGDTGPASNHFLDANIEGEAALRFFSPAEAAADELGNPGGAGAVAFGAVVRSFEVDVNDGQLDVEVLGPRGPAILNAIRWNRVGNVTGDPIGGDIELNACPGVPSWVLVDPADRVSGALSEPGFDVRVVAGAGTLDSQAAARAALSVDGMPTLDGTERTQVINFIDLGPGAGGSGRVANNLGFPVIDNSLDNNDFAVGVEGWLDLQAGFIELAVNSDDGFTLEVGSKVVVEFPGNRGDSTSAVVLRVCDAGPYPFRLTMHERGGGASLEFTQTIPDGEFCNPGEGVARAVNDPNDTRAVRAYVLNDGQTAGDFLVALSGIQPVAINPADRVAGTPSNRGFAVATVGSGTGIGSETAAVDLICGNIADDGRGTGVGAPQLVPFIDFEQGGGNAGRVQGGETPYPGLAAGDPNNFAILAEGWLELPAGPITVIINSDDGFRLDIGRVFVSDFEGGRGASDTAQVIQVAQAGLYAFRITHHEGGGGASIEFTETDAADSTFANVVRVNDTDNGAQIRAYTTLTDGGGNVIDPADHLFPLCIPPTATPLAGLTQGTPSGPGFNVLTLGAAGTVNNESNAADLVCGVLSPDGRGGLNVTDVINFVDLGPGAGGSGAVGNDLPMPGLDNALDNNDFVIFAEGWLEIPAGDIDFVVNSDDGFTLWVGTEIIVEFPGNRGAGDSRVTVNAPQAGFYPFRIMMHERGGGASVEFRSDATLVNGPGSPVRAWRTLTDGAGNVLDPNAILPALCAGALEECPVGPEVPELVSIMGGLGASADAFISPLGEDVALAGFGLTTTIPLETLAVTGSAYTGAGAAPTVVGFVSNGDGTHVVTLDGPIEPGNWLRLDLEVTGVSVAAGVAAATAPNTFSVWLAHQPLDVDQDGSTTIRDATAFGEVFRGSGEARLIDINGDATVNVRDATGFGNNWNGLAPATQAWRNTSLPARP